MPSSQIKKLPINPTLNSAQHLIKSLPKLLIEKKYFIQTTFPKSLLKGAILREKALYWRKVDTGKAHTWQNPYKIPINQDTPILWIFFRIPLRGSHLLWRSQTDNSDCSRSHRSKGCLLSVAPWTEVEMFPDEELCSGSKGKWMWELLSFYKFARTKRNPGRTLGKTSAAGRDCREGQKVTVMQGLLGVTYNNR